MAATGTPTPNLGLRIPLGTDPASVDDINYNSNALDTIIGDIGDTSVTAQLGAANNRISAVQAGLAIVCNGNTHAAIESGQFAYVKNHGTLAEGLYRNNTGSTIAANATLSSSNLTADSSGGLNTVYESLNSRIANVANYAFGTARIVEAISITQDVVFEAKIDCSNIVPNNKVVRILGAWIGINPAGNEMMVAQSIGSNYITVYIKSQNTQTVSADTNVSVALLYKD